MLDKQAYTPTMQRKIRREKRAQPLDGLPKMSSMHYLEWLEEFHQVRKPDVYFEIGTESGASLSLSRSISIAVDPVFKVEPGVIMNLPQVHLFQQTSDDFFELKFLESFGKSVDLAFLDGMHLIEFLLRDFINIERNMTASGQILIHDCVPMSYAASLRDWDKKVTRAWVGDVWKIVPILRKFRPDLKVRTLDLAPSGLVIVSNLSPENNILSEKYSEILDTFLPITLEDYGLTKLKDQIQLEASYSPHATEMPNRWEMPNAPASEMLRIAIKTPKALKKNPNKIVDLPVARGLADGFLEAGHAIRIDTGPDWYSDTQETDFDVLIRGRGGFTPQKDIPLVNWIIYPGKKERHKITTAEIDHSSHTFVASMPALNALKKMDIQGEVSLLMQGIDHNIMHPPAEPLATRNGIVLVGSNHFEKGQMRPIVDLALKAGIEFSLWGSGWIGTDAEPFLVDSHLDNSKLGELYRNSSIILCDHLKSMRMDGYISNRIFDGLACGAAVISDKIDGLPQDASKFVNMVETPDELLKAIKKINSESMEKRRSRQAFAKKVVANYSYFSHANHIVNVLLNNEEIS